MFKKLATLLAGAALLIAAGSANATSFNNNRPFGNATSLSRLQQVFDDNFKNITYDVVSGQSSAAVWKQSDAGNSSAFAVAAARGDSGQLWLYSVATGYEVLLMSNPGTDAYASFFINNAGTLKYGGSSYTGFGKEFGFVWVNTSKDEDNSSFTEDAKNGETGGGVGKNIRALTYAIKDGTGFKENSALFDYFGTETAANNDDWVIAFEDLSRAQGADYDFDDAVFYVKDISAVPEPGTMVLLGAGMLGLAIFGKRRMNREA